MKKRYIFLTIFIALLLFTRFYNLEHTGVFFWDQAYDLNRIWHIFREQQLTLIGPISEDGSKVYSSLTYYLLLPFAFLFNFSAASTTYGAAFYGVCTALILWLTAKGDDKRINFLLAALLIVWFPLVEISRWAWNPNFVPLWIGIAILLQRKNSNIFYALSGFVLGMSVHHHYLAIISCFAYILVFFLGTSPKRFKRGLLTIGGMAFALSPFVIFDLTHPPGLFYSRILHFNQTETGLSVLGLLSNMGRNVSVVFTNYLPLISFRVLFILSLLWLFGRDIKQRQSALKYVWVWAVQIVGVSLFANAYTHYFLAGLPFFILYLAAPRDKLGRQLSAIVLSILVGCSLITVNQQLQTQAFIKPAWRPSIAVVESIVKYVATDIQTNDFRGVNLAVLNSADPNRYGWKYRSLLEIQGVDLMSKYEYFTNSYLYVVSTATESELRADISPEIHNFKDQKLVSVGHFPNTHWKVYLFSY